MKQKTGRKLVGVLLALVMVIGLMPGMSLTAYAVEVSETIAATGNMQTHTGKHFSITSNTDAGYYGDPYGIFIGIVVNPNENTVTVSSLNGETIIH